jgi:hypothetical protein
MSGGALLSPGGGTGNRRAIVHASSRSGGVRAGGDCSAAAQACEGGGDGLRPSGTATVVLRWRYGDGPEWRLVKAQQERGRSDGFWVQGAVLRLHSPDCRKVGCFPLVLLRGYSSHPAPDRRARPTGASP